MSFELGAEIDGIFEVKKYVISDKISKSGSPQSQPRIDKKSTAQTSFFIIVQF